MMFIKSVRFACSDPDFLAWGPPLVKVDSTHKGTDKWEPKLYLKEKKNNILSLPITVQVDMTFRFYIKEITILTTLSVPPFLKMVWNKMIFSLNLQCVMWHQFDSWGNWYKKEPLEVSCSVTCGVWGCNSALSLEKWMSWVTFVS